MFGFRLPVDFIPKEDLIFQFLMLGLKVVPALFIFLVGRLGFLVNSLRFCDLEFLVPFAGDVFAPSLNVLEVDLKLEH